jgi:hypothetical protein
MNLKFILVSCFLFINIYVVDAFLSLSPKIPLINKQISFIIPNLYLTENSGGIGGGNNRICNGNNNGDNHGDGDDDDYKYFYWIVILNMCLNGTNYFNWINKN